MDFFPKLVNQRAQFFSVEMCSNQTEESNQEINNMIINLGQNQSLLWFWPLLMGSEPLWGGGKGKKIT